MMLLILAVPVMAGLRPMLIEKKRTTFEPQSLTKPEHKPFGAPRRDRGQRYFVETDKGKFQTHYFNQEETTPTTTKEKVKAAKALSPPKKTVTYSGTLSNTKSFGQSRFSDREKDAFGKQLRAGITK